jgi:ATP/maltotriose-dependent transcriptional regulator MalT
VELLERAGPLEVLADRLSEAVTAGRLVLVSGEAGAGKSALVQRLLDEHPEVTALIGRCDDLFAPRPLGPLADIARERPGPLADAMASGEQGAIFDAFLAELAEPTGPVVVVLEDLQWADEATLDLLRFVTRRLESLRCLVVATHRDDLARDHPLRRSAGSLIGPLVTRVRLEPLSVNAVRELVGDRPLDPMALHVRTGGNPFFLVEVLDGEPDALPATVRDAVLARTVALSGAARDALDAAAVLGRQVGADLIQQVGDCDSAAVDECIAAGLLVDDGGHQAFRHDLGRQAVEEAMSPLRRRQLHARALEALAGDGDVVRRAHHAVGARDGAAVAELAARAGHHCEALGANRQAAALFGEALQQADRMDPAERLSLLEARWRTCQRVEQVPEAIEAAEEQRALLEAAGDVEALAQHEAALACIYHDAARPEDSERTILDAVRRLDGHGASPALARVLDGRSGLLLVTGRFAASIDAGRRARAIAEELELEDVAVHAMDMYGTAMAALQDEAGLEVLRESIDRAKRAGLPNDVALAAGNLGGQLVLRARLHEAVDVYEEGLAVAEQNDLRFRANCLIVVRAEVDLLLGRWDAAAAAVGTVLTHPDLTDGHLVQCNLIVGRLRALRGDPNPSDPLDLALHHAQLKAEPQFLAPVRMARAEAAWLAGDTAGAASEVELALDCAELLDRWQLRDLALWALRSGVAWAPPVRLAAPYDDRVAGDMRAVARHWAAAHMPYHAADALGDSDDVADLREAHEQLLALGARPRAQQVARRLRDLGAKDVPRGPRASTRANPAGLTAREVEVAGLLADGLTNAEIAARLVLSPKTVDHHVSAVLSKLGVRNRRQVREAADRLGVPLQDGVVGAAT